jgi:hypothetical protein
VDPRRLLEGLVQRLEANASLVGIAEAPEGERVRVAGTSGGADDVDGPGPEARG